MKNGTTSIKAKNNRGNNEMITMKYSVQKETKNMAKANILTEEAINMVSEYYDALVELVTSKADEEGLPVLYEQDYHEDLNEDTILAFIDYLSEDTGFDVTYNINTCECCGKKSVLYIFS